MPLRFPVKAIIFVFVIALAAMYQETPAQKKQPKKDTAAATKANSAKYRLHHLDVPPLDASNRGANAR